MVNIVRLTVAYLNATIHVKPETQNRRLEPSGLSKPRETRGLTGTGPGLPAKSLRVGFLAGSGTEPTRVCGPNPDRWRGTRTRC